jgi:sigma-E factor negative regulatory protein RseC
MLSETGRVVAVEADAIWVETIRQSTCGSCAANKGCGHSLLNRLGDGRRNYLQVPAGEFDIQRLAVDDEVRIAIPEEVFLRGSLIVYGTPLLGMLVMSALLAHWFEGTADLAAFSGAVLGFGIGVALVRWHAGQRHVGPQYQPRLLGPAEPVLMQVDSISIA